MKMNMQLGSNTSFEHVLIVLKENARLHAILYSIFKRHPHVKDWSLVLDEIDQDVPPDPLVVGWNTIGSSVIITLAFGETLEAMKSTTLEANE